MKVKKTLYAQWTPFMNAYKLFVLKPQHSGFTFEDIIGYVTDLDEAEFEYVFDEDAEYAKLVLCDADVYPEYEEW